MNTTVRTIKIPFKTGTTAQNDAYLGSAGEVTIDRVKRTFRVHDGIRRGGEEILRRSDLDEVRTLTQETKDALAGAIEAADRLEDTLPQLTQAATDAVAANTAAQQAKGIAEGARDTAVGAKDTAVQARDTAVGAKDTAVSAKGLAEGARDAAVTAKGLSEGARDAAVTAKGLAEGARDAAVTAKGQAETAKGLAEGARDAAVTAKGLAEGARDAAVTAQGLAEGARTGAINAKGQAETARDLAQSWSTSQALVNGTTYYGAYKYALDAKAQADRAQGYADGMATGQVNADWNATSGAAQILNKPALFSGVYADLSGRPTIPTNTNQLVNGSNFITAAQARTAISVSGSLAYNNTTGVISYTPPALHAVSTSGNYNDLTNKPTIPAAQVSSDWNASSGVSQILNKPTITELPTANAVVQRTPAGAVRALKLIAEGSANYISIDGGATGVAPALVTTGTDTDVGMYFGTKGGGFYDFFSNGNRQLQIGGGGGANRFRITGGAATSNPKLLAEGSDTNVGFDFTAKGSGEFIYRSNNGLQFVTGNTANAVNYVRVAGNVAGQAAILETQGSDTSVGMLIRTKGPSNLLLAPNGSLSVAIGAASATQANFLNLSGNTTGNRPTIYADGTDANVSMLLNTKGTGNVVLANGGIMSFVASYTASGVNYMQTWSGATGGGVTTGVSGSDANIPFYLQSKGTSGVWLTNNGAGVLEAMGGTSGGNYFTMQGSAAGASPSLRANGADTNISINLIPKGAGQVTIPAGLQANALTLQQGAPAVYFNETDQTNGAGKWRMVADGNTLRIDKNSAADGNYGTYTTPWTINNNGTFLVLGLATGGTVTAGNVEVTAGNLNFNSTSAERRLHFTNSTTATPGMSGFFHRPNDNVLGCYDWINNRSVWTYNPLNVGSLVLERNVTANSTLSVAGRSYFTGRVETGPTCHRVSHLGSSSGTFGFDCLTTAEYTLTLTADSIFEFNNPPTTLFSQITYLRITNGGNFSINWPTGTKLQFTGALTANGTDMLAVKWDGLTSLWHVYMIKKGMNL